MTIKHNWTFSELHKLYQLPLLELVHLAATIHRQYHQSTKVQICHLISIKTGGCQEDCKYCAQSARYHTDVTPTSMMSEEEVHRRAMKAKARGATRICLGAAWRGPRDGTSFDKVLRIVKNLSKQGVEVCCTLGMLTENQAAKLKEAGTYAYNHNLDTSEEYYNQIVTTRTYQDRLDTLDTAFQAGLSVCCGGIIGMGETIEDRIKLLHTLANRSPHPDSVPINVLYKVPGTPLAEEKPVTSWELIRIVALARVSMPKSMVRLSAGRVYYSAETQALCFLAGANSIFMGDKMLTVPNQSPDADEQLFKDLGINE